MKLKRSYKNLRWEEAFVVYSMRHKLDMSFEEFTENYIGGDNFDWDEFEEITKDIRHLVNLPMVVPMISNYLIPKSHYS